MPYTAPVETPSGRIREVTIGSGPTSLTVGGAKAMPFYSFDGDLGRRPLMPLAVGRLDAVCVRQFRRRPLRFGLARGLASLAPRTSKTAVRMAVMNSNAIAPIAKWMRSPISSIVTANGSTAGRMNAV